MKRNLFNLMAIVAIAGATLVACQPTQEPTNETNRNWSEDGGLRAADNLLFASVGLNLSVPLYDRMQTTTRMRQQRLAVDNAKLQLAQQKQTLRKEIDQAYYNALSAQLEEQSATEAERSAAEALRYAEQKQEAGRASAYEYREAKNTYAQALATRLQARYNLLFRIRILHYYQGTL